jgi:hypothetical protein
MADTGWIIAGQGRAVARPSGISDWTNPGNITADDGTAATVNTQVIGTAFTNWLVADTFNFASIPAGSTINGIEVRVQLSVNTAANSFINAVNVGKADATLGTEKTPAQAVTASPIDYDFGTASDLWGLSVSLAEVQTSTFQALLSVNDSAGAAGRTFSCDAIWMRVTYTAPVSSPPSVSNPMQHMLVR